MVFVVKKTTTCQRSNKADSKIERIVGRDLRHAVEMIPIGPAARRDLERKYWTEDYDFVGRKVRYEIYGEGL